MEILTQNIMDECTAGVFQMDELGERIKSDKVYIEVLQRMDEIRKGLAIPIPAAETN